jgi:hypothetical protein
MDEGDGEQAGRGPKPKRVKKRVRKDRRRGTLPLAGLAANVAVENSMKWNGLYLMFKSRDMNNAGMAPPMPWRSGIEPIR